jgi:hypothetical protein
MQGTADCCPHLRLSGAVQSAGVATKIGHANRSPRAAAVGGTRVAAPSVIRQTGQSVLKSRISDIPVDPLPSEG